MNNKIVFAVVVTYKRHKMLQQVIDGLLKQTYPLAKIIIIDNNSQDGTKEMIENIIRGGTGYEIEYHNTYANLGGAGGFEFGFRVADAEESGYDFLWLMDDDLLPDINCLEKLIDSSTAADIVQPLRINMDGVCAELSPVIYDLSTPWLINPKRKSVIQKMEESHCDEVFDIAGIPFEGPLISKAMVSKIGYPNPEFFIFNDDLDYALRAKKAGGRIVCQPQAIARRLLVNNQSDDLKSWKGYFMLRNHFYILRTHGENPLVRCRPYFMTLAYCFLNTFKGELSLAKICIRALRDSKSLANNQIYRP